MNDDYEHRRQGLTRGLRNLWINWAFPLAGVIGVIIIAPFVSKMLMPLIVFALTALLFSLIRNNRRQSDPSCYKIPYINALILFWTATLLVIFNSLKIIHTTNALNGQPYNVNMPFIPILVIAPIGIVITSWFIWKGENSAFCRDCEARTGQNAERGFLGRMNNQETKYQEWFMLVMWSLLTVVVWGYYFMFYININLNKSDRFIYCWLPTAVYVLSLIYMGIRYYSVWAYYIEHDPSNASELQGFSRLRFLVICDDKMLLHIPDSSADHLSPENMLIDTPAKITVNYRSNVSQMDGAEWFRKVSGIKNAEVRRLYVSSDKSSVSNIFHFAAYIESYDTVNESELTGEWFNLAKIQTLHQMGLLSNLLEAEFDRIHRIVMAWKTYTRDGKRLYKIRHYRPTFRLNDMRRWDVDYGDNRWLFVEMNNEDRPFFHLRRFWRKYITGLGS